MTTKQIAEYRAAHKILTLSEVKLADGIFDYRMALARLDGIELGYRTMRDGREAALAHYWTARDVLSMIDRAEAAEEQSS